ncbi:DoxX-like family protein [Roseateles cavernae]|uniref:DoxX-like family protein n=1 Tax=Roseateles cavernae TaxID=3153578 RepID=UPI0032E45D89
MSGSASAPADERLLRLSLVAVWLGTAVVSLLELRGQSLDLLTQAGMHDLTLMQGLIVGGAALDALLGLALWLRPGRRVYAAALAAMLAMTALATLLLPSLWLHPLGPLLKNLPIAAALWLLCRKAPR